MSNPAIPMLGLTFGRLTVVERAENYRRLAQWLCECECGGSAVVRGSSLRSGQTRSCGCLALEHTRSIQREPTHGHTRGGLKHPLYAAWAAMRQRCQNPAHHGYANYGGRGITVCERWRDFGAFLADMGERPEGLTLDRIDNDGNYEPGNCRWATALEQRHNQRVRHAA